MEEQVEYCDPLPSAVEIPLVTSSSPNCCENEIEGRATNNSDNKHQGSDRRSKRTAARAREADAARRGDLRGLLTG